MQLKPVYPRIAVKRFDPPEKTASGIALPDVYDHRFCKVVAVHEGKLDENGNRIKKSDLNVGDCVLIFNFDVEGEIKIDGEKYELVSEHNCNCVVPEELITEFRICHLGGL